MILLDIGRRENGKTTLGYYMAQRVKQRVILDPRAMIRPKHPRAVIVETTDDLLMAFDALIDHEIDEIVFTPVGDLQESFETFAAEVRAWVQATPRRPLAVLVDECAFVNLLVNDFLYVLRCSRRDTVQIILTCHRPSDVPTSIRAIADAWAIFHMTQEHDLDVIEKRCGIAVIKELLTLKPYQFVFWNDAKATFEVKRDSHAWHVSLSPTARELQPPS